MRTPLPRNSEVRDKRTRYQQKPERQRWSKEIVDHEFFSPGRNEHKQTEESSCGKHEANWPRSISSSEKQRRRRG